MSTAVSIHDRLIRTSTLVIRTCLIVNRVFIAAVLLGELFAWLTPVQLATALFGSNLGPALPATITGMRLEILLGITEGVFTDRLLVALSQIIASTGHGDPFILANAVRLRTIGWYLLCIQLLAIPGGLLGRFFPSLGSAAPGFNFSAGGWISVLMVFVLSRIFAAGAAMRDDLEGTV
jgi:Protein of unknown function (DUF2975)